MTWRLVALRWAALVALAVWTGGFTFYSAVVVPALHDTFTSAEAGALTQRVTNPLNDLGLVAVAAWWLLLHCEGPTASRLQGARPWLLGVTTVLLFVLIGLHRIMDQRLAAHGLRGFYPYHRAYLIVSTVQWFTNLGLFWTAVVRS